MATVELSRLPPDTPASIVEFLGHWNALRHGALIPHLSDYLDHAVPHLQPFVMISDMVNPTEMRVRLMGTGLVRLLGGDATGQIVKDYYAPDVLAVVQRAVRELLTRPVGYLCVRSVQTRSGQFLSSPSICLPLASQGGMGRSLLSYTHVDDSILSNAERDRLDPVQGLRITNWIDLGAGTPA